MILRINVAIITSEELSLPISIYKSLKCGVI